MRNLFVAIFILLAFSGCGLFRGGGASSDANVPTSSGSSKEITPVVFMMKNAVTHSDLTYTAVVNLKAGGTDNSVNANIRIRKDSVIWISARKLGFEIGRLMMTTDSVWVMDRINSRYFAGDYLFFRKQFNIDLDYNLIESLMLGNPLTDWSDDPVNIDCTEGKTCRIEYPGRYRVNQPAGRPEGSTTTDHTLVISIATGRILEQTLSIRYENRRITARYGEFKNVSHQQIPAKAEVSVDNQGVITDISILADAFKAGERSTFPFTIPSSYKPMEVK
ncbi:MAG: DUF4292 domain-containing protein [Bacteroidales bacterium]